MFWHHAIYNLQFRIKSKSCTDTSKDSFIHVFFILLINMPMLTVVSLIPFLLLLTIQPTSDTLAHNTHHGLHRDRRFWSPLLLPKHPFPCRGLDQGDCRGLHLEVLWRYHCHQGRRKTTGVGEIERTTSPPRSGYTTSLPTATCIGAW